MQDSTKVFKYLSIFSVNYVKTRILGNDIFMQLMVIVSDTLTQISLDSLVVL